MKHKLLIQILSFGVIAISALSCTSHKPITERLFLQSKRTQIYLPTKEEERGGGVLVERARIQTTVDTIRPTTESKPADDSGSITLETFTVTAERPHVKISTVRNGYVSLSFLTTLPKAFMDERWQVLLTPTLINGEERQELPPLVIKGRDFAKAQDAQYARMDEFRAGIVDSARYDSVFFDKPRHEAFISKLQRRYLWDYERQFRRQLKYEQWRRIMEQRRMHYDALYAGRYDSKVATRSLDMLQQAYALDLERVDTTAMKRQHAERYTAERRSATLERQSRPIRLEDVPRAYRHLYEGNQTVDSIRNHSVTEQTEREVAQHTWHHKAIARNESMRTNQKLVAGHIIKLPRVEGAHETLEMTPDKDFAYLYSRDVEVREGIKRKLQIVVDTRVVALDQSTWRQAGIDTLSYIVSGMNDLVDRTLIDRLEGEAREEYQRGLDRLANYDYNGALDYLNRYPDYNSAICLAALGHNDQAMRLLDMLTPASARMDYLRALIYARSKHLEHARYYLLSAAKREVQLAYKAEIEPEFGAVLETYPTLVQELEAIAESEDF